MRTINNAFYDELGEDWYEDLKGPIALLRAEARLKNPWVKKEIEIRFGSTPARILDAGCGAGFLSNDLASAGHSVVGIDASASTLDVARKHDLSGRVDYRLGDAYSLPFDDSSFDVVCAMDFLEHVDRPWHVVLEAARVLKPGGLFLFHTFNRNWISRFVVIQLLEWLVPAVPRDMHVYHLFIRPRELEDYCNRAGLSVLKWTGIQPRLFSKAALRIIRSREVAPELRFGFTRSTRIGYLGVAKKDKHSLLPDAKPT